MHQKPHVEIQRSAESIAHQITHSRDILVMTNTLLENCNDTERFEKLARIHATVRAGLTVASPPALQVVFDIMLNEENSAQTRGMMALGILDRAGHSTKTQPQGQDAMHNVTPKLDEMSMEDMSRMLQDIQKRLDTQIAQAKT